MNIGDINPDVVRRLSDERAEDRQVDQARNEVKALGRELADAKRRLAATEAKCAKRAKRLYIFQYNKGEIGEMFSVPRRTVGRWLQVEEETK